MRLRSAGRRWARGRRAASAAGPRRASRGRRRPGRGARRSSRGRTSAARTGAPRRAAARSAGTSLRRGRRRARLLWLLLGVLGVVGRGVVAGLDAALEAIDRRACLLLDALLELLDLLGMPDRAD